MYEGKPITGHTTPQQRQRLQVCRVPTGAQMVPPTWSMQPDVHPNQPPNEWLLPMICKCEALRPRSPQRKMQGLQLGHQDGRYKLLQAWHARDHLQKVGQQLKMTTGGCNVSRRVPSEILSSAICTKTTLQPSKAACLNIYLHDHGVIFQIRK